MNGKYSFSISYYYFTKPGYFPANLLRTKLREV